MDVEFSTPSNKTEPPMSTGALNTALTAFSVEVVNTIEQFTMLRPRWTFLHENDPESHIFLSWEWLSGWLTGTPDWFILSVNSITGDCSSSVAFFPFRLRLREVLGDKTRQEITMAGNRGADYNGFLCLPKHQNDAIIAVCNYLKQQDWDTLFLEDLRISDNRLIPFLDSFASTHYEKLQLKKKSDDSINNQICPYISLPSSWDNYLKTLQADERRKIRKYMQQIENSTNLCVRFAGSDNIIDYISILMRFWRIQWATTKAPRLDRIVVSYETILRKCFESELAKIAILWDGDVPVSAAALLVDEKNKSLMFYIGSRDQMVTSPPPGLLLHTFLIRYAIENGFESYDFLRGNESYKYLFNVRERYVRYFKINKISGGRFKEPLLKKQPVFRPVNKSSQDFSRSFMRDYLLFPDNQDRSSRILFLAKHALDSSPERKAKYGGHVVYHEILLNTMREIGFDVTPAADHSVLFTRLDFDFLYAIHSHAIFDGHELLASAIAAHRGVGCLGSAATTRAISEDKILAKHLAVSVGLEVAKHQIITPGLFDIDGFSLAGSWILKPRGGIASEAVAKVDSRSDWRHALAMISDPRNEGRDFIAEEFVPGLNLTVPVVEGFPAKSLAVFEEGGRPGDNVITHEGKRGFHRTYSIAPYKGPGAQEALEAAAQLAAEISPFDYARFDFRYDPEARRLVFIELNIACNMAPGSAFNRAMAMHGIKYEELVQHVLTYSLRRQRVNKQALKTEVIETKSMVHP